MEGVLATSRIDTTMFLSTTDFFITCFRNILLMHDLIIHTQTHIYIYIYIYIWQLHFECMPTDRGRSAKPPPAKEKNSEKFWSNPDLISLFH
jgi:hypothetical protein